jgi:hypothetical protein
MKKLLISLLFFPSLALSQDDCSCNVTFQLTGPAEPSITKRVTGRTSVVKETARVTFKIEVEKNELKGIKVRDNIFDYKNQRKFKVSGSYSDLKNWEMKIIKIDCIPMSNINRP